MKQDINCSFFAQKWALIFIFSFKVMRVWCVFRCEFYNECGFYQNVNFTCTMFTVGLKMIKI